MSSDSDSQPQSSTPQTSKGKRRSKHDYVNRTFQCGCGKSYLSYPALYTHVKNKHEGQQPEGTVIPEKRKNRGRGRPRKGSNEGEEGSEVEGAEGSSEACESLQSFGYFGGPAIALHG